MKRLTFLGAAVVACVGAITPAQAQTPTRFEVLLPASAAKAPVTGRLIVAVSRTESPEPRLAVNYQSSPPIFGADVAGLAPGATAMIDEKALGYPLDSLRDLPPGEYYAQALLIVYKRFQRADGHTVWLPPPPETLIHVSRLAGNLYSEVRKLRIEPGRGFVAKLALSKVIPPVDPPRDTEWIKHVRIKSKLLSKFWGSPIYLGANVLLPKGYDEHPDAHYPVAYVHIHDRPFLFDSDPKSRKDDADLKGSNLQTGYEFYQSWISDNFPRFIGVTFFQGSPYFPDAYSVNSANNGPYGDALMQELIPYIEKHFRIIGKPYARVVEGASTGGWETLALMLRRPDFFGGAWIFNPDPIDFHRYQLVNIYEDDNAFCAPQTEPNSEWRCLERPMRRTTEGQVTNTVRSVSRFEAVLGTHGRSGYQLNGWEAVYGPVGDDGYPVPLWDKLTGKIDHKVAEYMRDHGYDLTEYARRNWPALGPRLIGKLNFFSGEMDNYHLNLAVYRFQNFLRSTENPHYEGRFEFGRPMKGHNWHPYNFADMLREMAEQVKKNAPPGADTAQWNY